MPAAVRTVGSGSSPADIAKVLNEDGCVVIPDLAPPQTMDQIRAELEPYLAATGGGNTDFLGATTEVPGCLMSARSASGTRPHPRTDRLARAPPRSSRLRPVDGRPTNRGSSFAPTPPPALGRADVADDTVGGRVREYRRHRLGQQAYRHRTQRALGVGDRLLDRLGRAIDGAALERDLQQLRARPLTPVTVRVAPARAPRVRSTRRSARPR